MHFPRTSCIRIPISYRGQPFFDQIVNDLKRKSRDYENPDIEIITKYYDVRDGNLLIPRHYEIEKFGHHAVTYLHPGEDIDIEFKSEFRNDLQRLGHEMMVEQDHGVLCLQPGEGKTVVAISAICKVAKKSIIFVHKNKLASQWKERFLQHSNMSEDDIAMLSTATCRDDLKKPIIISTVQTMGNMVMKIDDIEQILCDAHIGYAVWDECHTSVSAEKFSLSSLYLPCPRCFGLSATPSRPDGNTDIIEKHVGKTHKPEGSGSTMDPKIIMFYFDHRAIADHHRYIMMDFKYKPPRTRFDKGKYLKMLTAKDDRTYIPVMKKIAKQIYDSGRRALLLTDRIKILDSISKVIPKHDVGFFIPRSGKEQDEALNKMFVFSTYGSARDGTDKPELDTLILATNCGNIEQAIGRVCRPYPNKQQPIVMDIVDTGCDSMVNSAERRLEFYTEKGWDVEEKHIKLN
jgi:superfamily II DNA or RNA helicase